LPTDERCLVYNRPALVSPAGVLLAVARGTRYALQVPEQVTEWAIESVVRARGELARKEQADLRSEFGDGWLIDGFGPDGISARVLDVTRNMVRLQTGFLYHYAFAMMIGVAAHYQTSDSYVNGAFGFGGPESSFTAYTIDFSVEGDGWNFFAAIMGSSTDFEEFTDFNLDGDPDSDFDDFGIVVQAGMFIPDTDWEVFVRWDGIFADDSERGGEEEFNTLTFGVNWYWSGHAAKFTLDAQIFLDESLGANGNNLASPNDGIGFIGDDDDSEVAIRAQFQLLF